VPLRDDLLNPIPGDNPSGASLRYDRISDQIKEARTEGEASILGNLASPKRADFKLVVKLAGEALANRSKDLQLAAWLIEAYVRLEGIGIIEPCLKLMLELQQQFWETLYPEIEEGDPGMRAVPIEWSSNRLAELLHEAPITKDGLSFYQYRESRAVGYEADTESSDSKREAREMAIADGKITGEEFDKSFAATPKSWYSAMDEAIRAASEALGSLKIYCEEKYGDDGPAFGKLHDALEEVGRVVGSLLNEKRKLEPDEPGPGEVEAMEQEVESESELMSESVSPGEGTPVARARSVKAHSIEVADHDDALARIQACATFLQNENPASPLAYLLQASLRFGETREHHGSLAWDFLAPPETEQRQSLKRLASEANWGELLNLAISVAGQRCGRGWLDVHRYIWNAGNELGYYALSASVVATLRSLLADIPELPTWTMSDDTPTANPETQRWLEEIVLSKPAEAVVIEQPAPEPEPAIYEPPSSGGQETAAAPDVLDLARDMMGRGHLNQAVQLLMRDAAQQPSGRARFQRRLQIAQMCASAGQDKVAFPVLEELVKEIDDRRLEEWEASDMIAPPLALLLRYLSDAGNTTMRDAVFARLCRIDPIAAMDVSR
jgi:type VI secretion system protein ImpA